MFAMIRVGVGCLVALWASSVLAEETFTPEQIVAAWKRGGEAVSRFEATYTLETIANVIGRGTIGDPFGEPSADGAKLKNELRYCFDGDKQAYRFSGDKQGFKGIYSYTFQAVFDGETYQQCTSGEIEGVAKPQPMGEIDRRGNNSTQLTRSSNLIAFYLCHNPATFLFPEGDITPKLKIVRQSASGTRRYAVVTVDDGLPDRRTTLLLMPDENFLPARWLVEYQGKPMIDLTIQYRKTETGENYVAGWTKKYDSPDGKQATVATAKLTKATVNQPVTTPFRIDFPVGAYVFEDTLLGRHYYEQGENKMLIPISEDEFGSLR